MKILKIRFLLKIFPFIFCLFCSACLPLTLENELFNSLQSSCNIQNECIINLHKITSFEWDRVYFFQNRDKNYIREVTKTSYDFQTDIGTQVVFIKNDKVVAYQEFFTVNDLNPAWNIKRKYIDIKFTLNKSYSNNDIYINYYYITPNNDKLKIKFNKSHPKGVTQESYSIYPTNFQQVALLPSNK